MISIASKRATRALTLVLPALMLAGCFGNGEGPDPIAGTPAPPPPDIPPGFCDPINFEDLCGPFVFTEFEGGPVTIIDNPDVGALNPTDKVARMQKFAAESGLTFGGSTLALPSGMDFTNGEAFTMLVWSSREVPVLFKFEGLGQERIVDHSGSGMWEELCFDFTGTTAGPAATGITFIFDVNVLGDAANDPDNWTFFFDEITQVESCGGGGGAPLALPITFDDAAADYELTDFGGATTTLAADPTDATNTVASTNKAPGAETFAGTTVAEVSGFGAIPFTATETTMTVRVYSPDAGIPVLLKVEDRTDNTVSVETFATTTVANAWETLTFDFSNEAPGTAALNLASTYDKASIFFNFGTDGNTAGDKTYLWDDVTFVTGGGPAQLALPVTFEDGDAAFYELTDFGGVASALVADPVDGANTVASSNKAPGAEVWGGTTVAETSGFGAIPFTATETTMTVRVYSPDAGIPVLLKVEDRTDNTVSVETFATTTVANAWETLTFDFSNEAPGTAALNLASTYDKASIFFNFGTDGNTAGDKTYLWDDVTFVTGGGGETAPTVAAPTPTQGAGGVISLFSDAYTDVAVDTWRTDWSAATLTDTVVAGDAVKLYTDLDFVGIETVASQIDASGMTHFSVDVWTPDATLVRVKLVDFGADGAFGGGDDTEHEVVYDGTTTPALTQGQWISLDIPLTDFVNLTSRSNIAQLIFSAQPAGGATLYVDNVYFYDDSAGSGSAPVVAAPTPAQDPGSVVSLFSDTYTDVTVDTWRTDWSSATLTDVTIDGQAVKQYTDLDFVGVETVASQIDASGMTHFHVDIWSPNATQVRIKLVDFGADGAFAGGDDTEGEVIFDGTTTPALVQGQWISLDIPLTDFEGVGLVNRSNIAQLIFSASPPGSTTLFVTNVYFYNDAGGATAPTVSAPTPTQDAAAVISLYSDAYTDVATTWPTPWSDPNNTTSDVTIDGGLVKEHLAVNFVGVEFQVDASSMTHVHFDVWTPDATSLLLRLVDFGGDGFGGANADTSADVILDNASTPALTQGSWVSVDIPLQTFLDAGLGSVADLNQIVLDPAADGSTVYIDNVYFYSETPATAPTVSAPTPTRDAAAVISLYSDAYTDLATTWPTSWSVPNNSTSDVTIDGGLVKEHLAINFVGVEFQTDASSMTHVHFDVWTPDATSLLFRLVDFGGDGFGGANADTSADVILDNASTPALTQGSWVSVDIPLQTFLDAGLGSVADLNQIVIDPAADGSTVYIDNVYFYDSNAASGGTFVNGDFETGDFTGWTLTQDPPGGGSITLDSSGQGGRAGTVARLVASGSDVDGFQNVVIGQVALGAGTIVPGDSIDVSFDLYGSLTGAGGVVFVEVIFLNAAGLDEGGRNFVGPAAPYIPTTTWTTHSGTVIAGTAVNGSQWDVSGGVTLELKVACGAVVGGCGVDASFDNVTFTINGP